MLPEMKPIPEYEGLYSVTRDGRVYSHNKNKYMSPQVNKDGYLVVNLSKKK